MFTFATDLFDVPAGNAVSPHSNFLTASQFKSLTNSITRPSGGLSAKHERFCAIIASLYPIEAAPC